MLNTLDQVYGACGVVTLTLVALTLSNLLRNRSAAEFLSRRLASGIGGLAYLAAVIWLDMSVALAVLGTMTFLIITLRLGFRRWLRGVIGRRPSQDWAVVTYTVAGTLSMAIGWGLLNDKRLAFLPVAFMAWGDNAAGLSRDTIWKDRPATLWPSVVMLVVCLGIAVLYQPFWISAVGAGVATVAERYGPRSIRFWDDNLNLVAASLIVMTILTRTILWKISQQ